MAALYHYNMHSSDVMRWLGGTYTGAYRLNQNTVELLQQHDIDPFLIAQYIRATTVGCPNHFVAEVSRDNFLEYLGRGNHPSVARYVTEVMNTLIKEHRNRFNMPLPVYLARYIPHLFVTPQALIVKLDKARLIFDASKRWTAKSISINKMSSTYLGTELLCLYGTTLRDTLERIYDLRITHPHADIVVHANDVKR